MRAYFAAEARRYLDALRDLLAGDGPSQPPVLLENVRALRGTAHVTREDAVLRAVRPLESALKAVARGDLDWSADLRERVAYAVADLDAIAMADPAEPPDEERIRAATARWEELGVAVDVPQTPAPGESVDDRRVDADFRTFAASEIAGIVEVLDRALHAFSDNPMDREALKAVLRRQRILLGAARLDEIPVAADTLRAVEDVSRIIAKMNVAIKDEWLDVFRCARQVLEAAGDPIANGETPPHMPALSRLRTYREELLDRYGAGEELSPDAPATEGLVQAIAAEPGMPPRSLTAGMPRPMAGSVSPPASTAATTPASGGEPPSSLDIQELIYTGEAALRRALELRARLERAVEDDPDALALVDEVFDLIRLALR